MLHKNNALIIESDKSSRKLLAELSLFAYQQATEVSADPMADTLKENMKQENLQKLGFNKQQADKYKQYQFAFDPKRGFKHYETVLKNFVEHNNPSIGKMEEEKSEQFLLKDAKEIFDQLAAQHPLGVEIWIYPKNASMHPLVENNSELAADSILSAASMMLHDFTRDQIKTFGDASKDQIERKHQAVQSAIEKEYKKTVEEIRALYENKDLDAPYLKKWGFNWLIDKFKKESSPEFKQYKTALTKILNFQKFVVSQLAAFQMTSGNLPSHDDYKKMYAALGKYEQKQKLHGYYPADSHKEIEDVRGNVFNQDIFTLDLDENLTGANWHYHDRHYTLTAEQAKFKALAESAGNEENEEVDLSVPQGTATSHSQDKLLANSAMVEEGRLTIGIEKTTRKIKEFFTDFIYARHGSTSPNELYPKSPKPRSNRAEKHEATVRAYMNMEQHLQKIRAKTIEAILTNLNDKFTLSPSEITHLSRLMSIEITAKISEKMMTSDTRDERELIVTGALNHSLRKVVGVKRASEMLITLLGVSSELVDLDEKPKPKPNMLAPDYLDQIFNVKDLHTHLITATGIGSSLQSQRYHFYDSRIAQYATWSDDNQRGYFYMSNGVNATRFDTLLFDTAQQLAGNNSVALIELYKEIAKADNYNTDRIATAFQLDNNNKNPQLEAYDKDLEAVKSSSREYISYLKNTYLPKKIAVDNLIEQIAKDQQLIKHLKSDPSKAVLLQEIQTKLNKNLDTLKGEKIELRNMEKTAQGLRNTFTQAEATLHKRANILSKEIYKDLNKRTDSIEKLADDPAKRSHYLSQKAFLLVTQLIHETQGRLGLAKWKSDDFNGILQTLVNLATEQTGLFASGGCKSANDREFLLALLITQISSYTDTKQPLTLETLSKLLQEAQKAYAWHISRRQTALDTSALPKTGSDILKFARTALEDFAKLEGSSGFSHMDAHTQYERMSADKRRKPKELDSESIKRMSYRADQDDFALLASWNKTYSSGKFHGITQMLEKFMLEKGLDTQQKIDELTHIHKEVKNLMSTPEITNELQMSEVKKLSWQLELRIFVLKAQLSGNANSPQYEKLKNFLDGLKLKLQEKEIGSGKGVAAMKTLMENYKVGEAGNFKELCELYMGLKAIADTRHNDWTDTFAKIARNSFFAQKRPPWLQELYRTLQEDVNTSELNSFDNQQKINNIHLE